MAAGTFNLEGKWRMQQGATYYLPIRWMNQNSVVYDLSSANYSAKLQVRQSLTLDDSAESFTCTSATDDGITLSAGAGTDPNIVVIIAADKTALLDYIKGYWSLHVIYKDGDPDEEEDIRLLEGTVDIVLDATR
jgi:hypothetical protein